jgi:hypothetical protein
MSTDEDRAPNKKHQQITLHLPREPQRAFALLPTVTCVKVRQSLASSILQNWAQIDINEAWKAVNQCSLPAEERQRMLIELWN